MRLRTKWVGTGNEMKMLNAIHCYQLSHLRTGCLTWISSLHSASWSKKWREKYDLILTMSTDNGIFILKQTETKSPVVGAGCSWNNANICVVRGLFVPSSHTIHMWRNILGSNRSKSKTQTEKKRWRNITMEIEMQLKMKWLNLIKAQGFITLDSPHVCRLIEGNIRKMH